VTINHERGKLSREFSSSFAFRISKRTPQARDVFSRFSNMISYHHFHFEPSANIIMSLQNTGCTIIPFPSIFTLQAGCRFRCTDFQHYVFKSDHWLTNHLGSKYN